MRAVFLDRDGVINRKPPEGEYVRAWAEFELLKGAAPAIRVLKEMGFLVLVVTNQRGVARGVMTRENVEDVHRRMRAELARRGACLDGVYYCPHEDGQCGCRKPEVGLFLQAREDHPEISFQDSFVIGDSWRDMEAGRRLGCRNILIGGPVASGTDTALLVGVAPSLRTAVRRYVVPAHAL